MNFLLINKSVVLNTLGSFVKLSECLFLCLACLTCLSRNEITNLFFIYGSSFCSYPFMMMMGRLPAVTKGHPPVSDVSPNSLQSPSIHPFVSNEWDIPLPV